MQKKNTLSIHDIRLMFESNVKSGMKPSSHFPKA